MEAPFATSCSLALHQQAGTFLLAYRRRSCPGEDPWVCPDCSRRGQRWGAIPRRPRAVRAPARAPRGPGPGRSTPPERPVAGSYCMRAWVNSCR